MCGGQDRAWRGSQLYVNVSRSLLRLLLGCDSEMHVSYGGNRGGGAARRGCRRQNDLSSSGTPEQLEAAGGWWWQDFSYGESLSSWIAELLSKGLWFAHVAIRAVKLKG